MFCLNTLKNRSAFFLGVNMAGQIAILEHFDKNLVIGQPSQPKTFLQTILRRFGNHALMIQKNFEGFPK